MAKHLIVFQAFAMTARPAAASPGQRPLRLEAQDTALSRRQRGFESPRGHQLIQPLKQIMSFLYGTYTKYKGRKGLSSIPNWDDLVSHVPGVLWAVAHSRSSVAAPAGGVAPRRPMEPPYWYHGGPAHALGAVSVVPKGVPRQREDPHDTWNPAVYRVGLLWTWWITPIRHGSY